MKKKEKITTFVFLIILFGFSLLGLFLPDKEISIMERRRLATAPEISMKGIMSGKTMNEFEDYVVDQFPFREDFCTIKAWMLYHVYRQKDNHGVYLADNVVSKLEYPANQEQIGNFTDRINHVYNLYLQENDRVYYTIVPDKNYFLAEEHGYPVLDYQRLVWQVQEELSENMEYIDIFDTLTVEDYYRTDIHWSSEKLGETAKRIAETMGFSERFNQVHDIKQLDTPFYGVYYGYTALPMEPDSIFYITSPDIEEAVVTDYDKNITGGIYYKDYQKERDDYSYFLNGSSSLLVIDNPNAGIDRELVLFRDSFGSALAPWLVEAYSRITVVDIRYIAPEFLGKYVDFEEKDILFLYSTPVINTGMK